MLDFNHKAVDQFNVQLNMLIDQSLQNNRQKGRSYLGASRLGVSCSRLLQYEYQNVTKDEGKEFIGQTLRVFEVGHVFEEMAINWLRGAGFSLLTANKMYCYIDQL